MTYNIAFAIIVVMQNERIKNLKIAEKGIMVSIVAYLFLAILQIALADIVNSDALRANGFNSLTDIFGNVALLIGLRVARIPADEDHVYGHWKVESIASLISSFIMAIVGFDVMRGVISNFFEKEKPAVDPLGAIVGLFSAFVILGVYFYNRSLAKKVNSSALVSAYKDNFSDVLTSLSTALAILAAALNFPVIDTIGAIFICGLIFKTAYDIFKDSAFSLSDGFDDDLLDSYRKAIEEIEEIKSVRLLRGRSYGANIFLDVVVEMSPDMSVSESHDATEKIEKLLADQFDVFDVDVHVEPSLLPESERRADLSLLLLEKEERLLQGEDLRHPDFQEITESGEIGKGVRTSQQGMKHYKAKQLSARSFILTYENEGLIFSSIWRREENWLCFQRQITKKN